MRVALLHYRDDAALGGSLRVGQFLGQHFDPNEVEAHFVFAYGGPGPVARTARLPCHFIGAGGPADLAGWARARRLLRKLDPHVLHFIEPVFWLNVAFLDWRRPRIVHVHGPIYPAETRLRDRFIWRALRDLVTLHICITHEMRDILLAAGWGKKDSTHVVYNSVDCSYFSHLPSRAEARQTLGLPSRAIILGMVCRQIRSKGCLEALDVLRRLPPRYHVIFCGAGPLNSELRTRAARPDLVGRAHFLGILDDVRPAYAAMDMLLFLSTYETFGLVIAEAMAAGIPVVGLAGSGGYREELLPLVTQENCVLIQRPAGVPVEAPPPAALLDELAGTVQDLREAPARLSEMSEQARRWVRERFDVSRQVKEVTALYRDSLARNTLGCRRVAPSPVVPGRFL